MAASTPERHPFHPKALTPEDIRAGITIMQVDFIDQDMLKIEVHSDPYQGEFGTVIDCTESSLDGEYSYTRTAQPLWVMGIERSFRDDEWSDFHLCLTTEDCVNGLPQLAIPSDHVSHECRIGFDEMARLSRHPFY